MRKIYLSVLSIIIIVWIICTGFLKSTLTIQDIKRLSQKGNNLTWSDFDNYKSNEIGFGLYIKSYPIKDFDGYLLIGGGSPEWKMPLYIKITKEISPYVSATMDSEDIRYNDITYFLENN